MTFDGRGVKFQNEQIDYKFVLEATKKLFNTK